MNYLGNIKIENKNGVMVVSSREVSENFGKEHSKVLRAIQDKIEVNPILASPQYFIESTYLDKSNRQSKEYLMTRDGFSFLVMGFTGAKADEWKLKYIEAFNNMEKVVMQGLPTTYKEALQQLLEKEEAREKLQLAYDEMKPMAQLGQAISVSDTCILVGDMAKVLYQNGIEIGQQRLFKWLRENGYLCRKTGEMYNTPTQKSEVQDLIRLKETPFVLYNGTTVINKVPMITPKGQRVFIDKFLEKKKYDDKKKQLMVQLGI